MNPIETKDWILLYVARYGYLGYDDLVTLWVSQSKNYLYKTMMGLCEEARPLVRKLTFAADPRYGQLPYLFSLTRQGKDFLVRKYGLRPKDVRLMRAYKFHRDYWHRRKTIATRIAIEHAVWKAKWSVVDYVTYFGGMRPVKVLENYYLPDSILHLRSKDSKDLLFCLEIHNGRNVKEIVSQLDKHIEILQSGVLATRFWLPFDHRVLSVYEHASCMKRVMERIRNNPSYKYMRYYFLFKTFKSNNLDPMIWWVHIDNSNASIII